MKMLKPLKNLSVMSKAHELINRYDIAIERENDQDRRMMLKIEANNAIATMAKKEAAATLDKVLYELSNSMKNSYSRSDA